uniref:Putative toll-interleukin 1-resistance protein n=1 Tax=uncultured bacterium EC5 TaxID=672206 RepID=G4WV76_9BACT|nr:putative toll-interleukin 1-resistance protein [uncultured bacterium EC5]
MVKDVFISYRHTRKAEVIAFCEQLEAAGITVFRDEERVNEDSLIQRGIEHGLGNCKLLLAWFDPGYLDSRACTWELGRALIAGRRLGDTFEHALQRIVCIDPTGSFSHIPEEIWNRRVLDSKDPGACVAHVREQLAGITGTFGRVPADFTGNWYERECPRHPTWVGREAELIRIYAELCRGEIAMKGDERAPVAITGHGGEGKTMLAEQYAIRHASAYPSGVVWLTGSADGARVSPGEWLARLELELVQVAGSRKLGIPSALIDRALEGITDPRGRVRALKHLIEDQLERGAAPGAPGARGPYLWVVDDLPALGAEDVLLWVPNGSHVHCLVTMRGASAGATFRAIELRLLAEAQALRILTRHRPPADDPEKQAARSIVELLGRLPLALELSAAAVDTYQSLLEHLLLPLDEGLEPLFEELKDALPTNHASSIVKTFDRSLDLLEGSDEIGTRSKGEATWTLLRVAALLSPAPLPDVLALGIHREMGFPATWFQIALSRVRKAALLQRPELPERPFSQMHALLARTVVETRMNSSQKAALCGAIARATQRWLEEESTKPTGALDDRLFSAAAPLLRKDSSLESAGVAHALGALAYDLGRLRDATLLHQHAYAVRRRDLGEKDTLTVNALEGLALARMGQGELRQAKSSLEDVVSLRLASNGSRDRLTLRAIARLASALLMLGDFEAARDRLEWAWRVWQHVDPYDREALGCASNLALSLEALDEHERARELHAETFLSRRRVLQEDDSDTLDSLQHLALIDLRLGDLRSAESLFRRLWAARQRCAGPRSPEALSAMHNLAVTWRRRGKLMAACVLLKRAVDGLRGIWGERHPTTLSATHEWAEVLLARGESGLAVEMLEPLVEMRSLDLGKHDPNTLNSMATLARAYLDQGRLDRARALQAFAFQAQSRLPTDAPP